MAKLEKDILKKAINNATPWDVGTTIHRTNPLPIDQSSVIFIENNENIETAASEAAQWATAYPGHIFSVLNETTATPFVTQPGTGVTEQLAFRSYVVENVTSIQTDLAETYHELNNKAASIIGGSSFLPAIGADHKVYWQDGDKLLSFNGSYDIAKAEINMSSQQSSEVFEITTETISNKTDIIYYFVAARQFTDRTSFAEFRLEKGTPISIQELAAVGQLYGTFQIFDSLNYLSTSAEGKQLNTELSLGTVITSISVGTTGSGWILTDTTTGNSFEVSSILNILDSLKEASEKLITIESSSTDGTLKIDLASLAKYL